MVIGHRGGFFGPENSMKTFRAAIENKLEGIEFDVWLSKDQVPMVIHGGDNGQLNLYGKNDAEKFVLKQDALKDSKALFVNIDSNSDGVINRKEL